MKDIKKFIDNIKKYSKYMIYSAKADLKAEIAGSHLNWLWLVLNPLCMMIIYSALVIVVFHTKESYMAVFVIIGLTIWDYFNRVVKSSIQMIKNHRGIVTKVYIPKYVILISKTLTYLFKMAISFALVFILMIVFKVEFPFIALIYFIPLLLILYIVCFGIGTIFLHFGTYVEDLSNVIEIVLKLLFYMSGVFYSITERVPSPYSDVMVNANPAGFFMNAFRDILIYQKGPDLLMLGIWLLVGLLLSFIGIKIIHKYENSYVKVI